MSAFDSPACTLADRVATPEGAPAALAGAGATGRATVRVGATQVLFGTASWADRQLVRAGTFYPAKSMDAAQRLRFYSSTFPICEVSTTTRYPPSAAVTTKWVERTVDGFRFDVCAWSLLTCSPAVPDSLWPDLQGAVLPRFKDSRQLYGTHLPAEVLDECWERFRHAMLPLSESGRLGAVVLRYPRWFSPRPGNLDAIERAAARLSGFRVAVELPESRWYPSLDHDGYLDWLEARDLALVCTARPPEEPGGRVGPVACTSDLAFVRFEGRPDPLGRRRPSAHRYSTDELAAWVDTLADLASSACELHVVMDNAGGPAPVHNACQLASLLARSVDPNAQQPNAAKAQRGEPADRGPDRRPAAAKTLGRSSRLAAVDTTTTVVKGSSGIDLAVHHLGGDGPPLMLAHATGFHGRCWVPVADELTGHFSVWALDQRGHGSSGRPSDGQFAWELLASDLLEVLDSIGGQGWCAGGHSLGGGVALLAEARRPGTFTSICCYEPVVVPPDHHEASPSSDGEAGGRSPVSLATLARKRRAGFASRAAAMENYRSKPPFSKFDPAVLDLYVQYGFVDNTDGSVSLACRPDDEAAVFDMAPASPTWGLLGAVGAAVTVFAGRSGGDPVGSWAESIAARIPKGRFEPFESLDHFGPMTSPRQIGRAFAASLLAAR